MNRNRWAVECIGSASFVSLWEIEGPITSSSANFGKWGGSILGNDAVIVARELSAYGFRARCRLLDPTDADLTFVASGLGADSVVAVGGERGGRTRSLCLEDDVGRRSWIFSRLPKPNEEIGDFDADVVYVDYYPEFIEYLNRQRRQLERTAPILVLNFSALSTLDTLPQVGIAASILQASLPRNVTSKEAAAFAVRLAGATGAHKVFATMGANGAVLAMNNETWHSVPVVRRIRNGLGAGAVFSSQVIVGLSDGLDEEALLEWSVGQTSRRLEEM